jgi:transposase InsO family protein
LTRENGLNTKGRKKFIPTTNSKHRLPARDKGVNQEFQAGRVGEKWVSAITCL